MNRYGDNDGNQTQVLIDDLYYQYLGNKIIGVEDNATTEANGYDFADNGAEATVYENDPGTWEYRYDDNGNLIRDYNKEITSNIKYNYLNMPEVIDFGKGNRIEWIYVT